MENTNDLATEFHVVIVIRTVGGKEKMYRSPVYKSNNGYGMGPEVLSLAVAQRLREWLTEAMKNK